MTIKHVGLGGFVIGAICFAMATANQGVISGGDPHQDDALVRAVIERAYINGAFNDQDTAAMAGGFHKDFAIFSAEGDELSRYEIATWIAGIKERRARPDFDPGSTKMEGRITALDVTGGAASARIELRRDGQLIYTDYLSLLKFDSGWKIAAKVYHRHG